PLMMICCNRLVSAGELKEEVEQALANTRRLYYNKQRGGRAFLAEILSPDFKADAKKIKGQE
ncbi:MAG TPA: hypothetical protein GX528_00855, partial [Firmicutes bacterium]|nr:hypothetical protein [Bacillota bacterium]